MVASYESVSDLENKVLKTSKNIVVTEQRFEAEESLRNAILNRLKDVDRDGVEVPSSVQEMMSCFH